MKQIEVAPTPRGWRRVNAQGEDLRVVLDIRRDKFGDFFEIRTLIGTNQELLVLNTLPRKKHLLLLSRQFDDSGKLLAKQKFLCGQDEGHWFVAAIPEDEPVSPPKFEAAKKRLESLEKRDSVAKTPPSSAKGNGSLSLKAVSQPIQCDLFATNRFLAVTAASRTGPKSAIGLAERRFTSLPNIQPV